MSNLNGAVDALVRSQTKELRLPPSTAHNVGDHALGMSSSRNRRGFSGRTGAVCSCQRRRSAGVSLGGPVTTGEQASRRLVSWRVVSVCRQLLLIGGLRNTIAMPTSAIGLASPIYG